MNTLPRILLDARSAGLARNTGWERYTRSLANACGSLRNVVTYEPKMHGLPGRIWTDQVGLPNASRTATYVHFPSFPPAAHAPYDKCVVTIHDLTWWKHPETASALGRLYYAPLMKRASLRARGIVTVSRAMQDEMQDWFGRSVHVIPNRVSIDAVVPARRPAREKPYLLTVGSVEPRKNFARLAQAYSVAGIARDVDLLLVGRNAWGDLPGTITHVGAVSDSELRALMEGAHAVVSASLYEGFGLPVAEAVALGVPVVCSQISAHLEASIGGAVRFFDPLSVESMAHALRDAIEDPMLRVAPHNSYSGERVKEAFVSAYDAIRDA